MTTFAPGTNPDYANAYNNWFYGGGQKSGANQPRPSEFGRGTRSATGQQPNPAPAQPASGSAPVSMSAYGGGGYGQYAQPTRSAAQQAMPQFQQYGRQNDLSQPQGFNLWGAQGAAQGGMQGQSYTMPGYSQSFNTLTGQPTSAPQQSWGGNLAYQAPANRPAPVSWNTQGMDGQTYAGQQGFQQASQQRDAFMGGQGGLFERLGQYAANPQMGPPQFDFNAMLNSANDAITNTGFQNPFTNPMAQTPTPSLSQPFYDPTPRPLPGGNQQYAGGTPYFDERTALQTPGAAQPVQTQDVGDAYNPSQGRDSLPPVPPVIRAAEESPDYRPQTPRRNAVKPSSGSGDLAEQAAQAQQAELRLMQSDPTPARQDTTSTAGGRHVPKGTDQAVHSQLTKIDTELNKWERATYGTWQGSGPPQAWSDHINNLKRLRQRALAGDPAALSWSPKMQAPPPKQHGTVPLNRRGDAARFGGMRRNGDVN